MESGTGSSRRAELAAALHRLRSTLARLKAELELAESDGVVPPAGVLLRDLDEALGLLGAAEKVAFGAVAVLVVDDDERLGELTALGLRRIGYEAEAARGMRRPRPGEVVVFDLGLASGLDAAGRSELKAARPIVVTGATDPASRAQAARLDASDYLVKPIELEELAAAIARRLAEA